MCKSAKTQMPQRQEQDKESPRVEGWYKMGVVVGGGW